MESEQPALALDPSDAHCWVSERFLSSLFSALSKRGLSPTALLGDLPIAVDESGRVLDPVHWDHVCELMRRLEHHAGGTEGLELCGESLCERSATPRLSRLVAFAASPASLYRALACFSARRALPGLAIELAAPASNRLRIDVRLPEALRPCPQFLHLLTGAARALPRLLDMPEAIVTARIEARCAGFDVKIPASRTLLARIHRLLRSILSPGSVLQRLEDQQLELEARHARLARAHEELLERERRLHALSDAAVDTLCEIDAAGRIVFVSASVRELMGYSREQVTDSHYRLWVPTPLHGFAKERFESLQKAPVGTAIVKERIELHAAHGRRVTVEVSVRSHATASGEWRAVACLRDATSAVQLRSSSRRVTRIVERVLAGDEDALGSGPWSDPRKPAAPSREPAREAQSGTRSMSAPRARSFSSIRS
jgi:PAS domain S-box-containing protein